MDQNLCCLQEKFIKDLFVSEGLGAVIDEASYGYARCSMEIEPRHCNALGIPMGGTIFTLADFAFAVACNGVQREHNKKLNNGLPILHKVPPKRDYGRYFCIMAEKGGTSHGGLTEKLSLFFHAKKQEVNAYGR